MPPLPIENLESLISLHNNLLTRIDGILEHHRILAHDMTDSINAVKSIAKLITAHTLIQQSQLMKEQENEQNN